jgi:hypothetical protein
MVQHLCWKFSFSYLKQLFPFGKYETCVNSTSCQVPGRDRKQASGVGNQFNKEVKKN